MAAHESSSGHRGDVRQASTFYTVKNRDQKRLWAQHVKTQMLEHFDIPNRAKELVFKLGDEEGKIEDSLEEI